MLVKLNLKNNYQIVPEGERLLTITKAECTPSGKPNKLKITFQDSEGGFINSNYDFKNDKALYAMGLLLSIALGLGDGDDFDTASDTKRLEGISLICEVKHTLGTTPNDNDELPTFANVKKVISKYEGETNTPVQQTTTTTVESPRNSLPTYDL